MRRLAKWFCGMVLTAGMPLAGQVVVISGQVNFQGTSVPYAPIQICIVTSTGTPCVPTASIYSDYNLAHSVANPNSADANGNYTFYAASLSAPAFYVLQVTPQPGTTWSYVETAGLGSVSIPVPIAFGGTGAQTAQGAATNLITNNTIAPAEIGNAYFYCDQARFAGADFGASVNNCLAAVYAVGGGTADARSFTCPSQCMIGTANVTVGDGTHGTTLLLPAGTITRETLTTGSSAQILFQKYGHIVGQGKGVTTISGPGDLPGVQQAYGNPQYASVSDLSVVSTSIVAGTPSFQAGGVNQSITAPPTASVSQPLQMVPYFTGNVAHIAVYHTALSRARVLAHWTAGSSTGSYESVVESDSPVGYWPMTEASGTTAIDVIAGRNGTYTGTTVPGTGPGIPGMSGETSATVSAITNPINMPSYTWLTGGDWTLEGWFKNTYSPTEPTYMFNIQGGGQTIQTVDWPDNGGFRVAYTVAAGSGQINGGYDLTPSTWTYVVVEYHNGGYVFYTDQSQAPVGSDAANSVFQNLAISGNDVGTLMNSFGGCICYNKFTNVDSAGATFGIYTENSSGYATAVNSDQWTGGITGGAVGLLATGAGDFTFTNLDQENNNSANGAIVFANPDALNRGTDFAVGDTVQPPGGDSTAVLTVTAETGGAVTALAVKTPGTTYVNAPIQTMTVLTGSGSGLKADIITHAFSILMGGTNIDGIYQESGGGNYICGQGNYVNASSFSASVFDTYYGGVTGGPATMFCNGWEQYSGSTPYGGPFSNFVWGWNAAPNSIGVTPRYNGTAGWVGPYIAFFGQTYNGGQADQYLSHAYRSTAQQRNLWADGPAWSGQVTSAFGHAPWVVGLSAPAGGTLAHGRTTYASLGTPAAPTAAATGGTGTNYTYAVIAVDSNGGITLASSFTTVSGAASLDGTHYITITFPWIDGATCMGVVKGSTATALLSNNGVGNYPPCNNASGGIAFTGNTLSAGPVTAGIVTAIDSGQGTSSTSLPGRDSTADFLPTTLGVAGGTLMTGNQGTGALVQHSTGSIASGDVTKADASGNTVDGGVAASAIVTAGAPTVGQAACIKSLGPPILLGYCSTTPTSGTCTCN